MKICSGRNSAPIRCVSRRGRFPSRSGAKDGGAMPPLRSFRRRESRTAGFVFGRFWAADSVPLRIVPDCSAAPASRIRCDSGAVFRHSGAVRRASVPGLSVLLRRGTGGCRPGRIVRRAACAGRRSGRAARPFRRNGSDGEQRQRPLRGLRRTGSLFSSFRRIFGFRMSKLRIFPQTPPLSAPKLPVLLSACPASGVCPDRLFSYICPEKKR